MGIDTADPLNDGHEVILIGNFSQEGLAFFREDGQGGFAKLDRPWGDSSVFVNPLTVNYVES